MKKSQSQTKSAERKKSTSGAASSKTATKGQAKKGATSKKSSPSGKISTTAKAIKPKALKISREKKAQNERIEFLKELAAAGVIQYSCKEFSVSLIPAGIDKAETPETTGVADVEPSESAESSAQGEVTGEQGDESVKMIEDPEAYERDVIDSHLNG